MLLTITCTCRPATDLGYLLHKHPDRAHTFDLSFGRAHVVYPEASAERCTAALIVDVDPVGLVRGRGGDGGREAAGPLDQYVNDRPYAASSLLAVAIGQVFSTAMSGRSAERPELAAQALPLEAEIPALPCRGGGVELVRRLFAPLGWSVEVEPLPLDPRFPSWGASRYVRLRLTGERRLADLLAHLYVLVPVLDGDKHYWVGEDEVDKLLRRGEGWLAAHPEREQIASRYLRHRRSLVRQALARLVEEDAGDADVDEVAAAHAAEEEAIERRLSLNDRRLDAVAATLAELGARRVIDLGCGEGRLVGRLLRDRRFERVVGVDVSHRSLEIAAERLKLERMAEAERARVELLQGSITYRDDRFAGFDAAALVEVIEHVEPSRLGALERVVFEHARPAAVVLTTPNREYNARFEALSAANHDAGRGADRLRHRDHRFEWTRAELRAWADGVAERRGYEVRYAPVGDEDPALGAPTQMAVFRRREHAAGTAVNPTQPEKASA